MKDDDFYTVGLTENLGMDITQDVYLRWKLIVWKIPFIATVEKLMFPSLAGMNAIQYMVQWHISFQGWNYHGLNEKNQTT